MRQRKSAFGRLVATGLDDITYDTLAEQLKKNEQLVVIWWARSPNSDDDILRAKFVRQHGFSELMTKIEATYIIRDDVQWHAIKRINKQLAPLLKAS